MLGQVCYTDALTQLLKNGSGSMVVEGLEGLDKLLKMVVRATQFLEVVLKLEMRALQCVEPGFGGMGEVLALPPARGACTTTRSLGITLLPVNHSIFQARKEVRWAEEAGLVTSQHHPYPDSTLSTFLTGGGGPALSGYRRWRFWRFRRYELWSRQEWAKRCIART